MSPRGRRGPSRSMLDRSTRGEGHLFMRRSWRTIGALFVIGLALSGDLFGGTETHGPVFAESACDLPGISPEIAPSLRCGTVSVPRDYENPDSGSFRLAVVVVRSARQPSLPDPVVYISGGPGSPLTIYTE